ncbi:hypothetical protein GFJ95_04490 [Flavobacterium sp. LMO9]|nr:hypothetical protein [Flavobacterium sp. LMO9]MQP61948.1 hypothetical protein [Flavobacterium sp. LMO6]
MTIVELLITFHLSLFTLHFSLLTFHFSLLTSHFSLCTFNCYFKFSQYHETASFKPLSIVCVGL